MTPSTQLSRLNVSPIAHKARDDHQDRQAGSSDQPLAAPQSSAAPGVREELAAAAASVVGGPAAVELLRQQEQLSAVISTLLVEVQHLRRDADAERRQRLATEQQLAAVMKMVQQPPPSTADAGNPQSTSTAATPIPRSQSTDSAVVGAAVEAAGVLEEHLRLMEELRGQRRALAPRGAS
jgi:hypothetical protein